MITEKITDLNGLTEVDVLSKIGNGQTNIVSKKYTKTYAEIVFRNVFTFFNILLASFFLILLFVKTNPMNMFFIGTAVCNSLIGIIQEVKAKRTTDKLSVLSKSKVSVIRESLEKKIESVDIVLDDIVLLENGNQIPVDGFVREGFAEVNESLLTGESAVVKKNIGDKVLAGTFLVSGNIKIQANCIGNETYSAKLQKTAKQVKAPSSELIKSLRKIIKFIGIVILPVGILLFISQYLSLNNLESAVTKTIGSAVGMIPAGMFLLTSVALAVGVIRLSKNKALVQQMYSIEMLARTDTLCLDKTGTLTDGTMVVNNIIKYSSENVDDIMGSYLRETNDKNLTALALRNKFKINNKFQSKLVVPFSSDRKYSSVTFRDGNSYFLGAPEFLLDQDKDKEVLDKCSSLSQSGFRTIVLAKNTNEISIPENLDTVAIFVISDNVRQEVHATIKWFNDNDVDVKIISGDNPATVSAIAKLAGVKNAENFISLDRLSEDQVREVSLKYNIFGRVSPEQKAIIVDELKRNGRTVTITGDGTNDILAAKKADCSIAMGSGSDAIRNVADIVLLNNDFSVMNEIVLEGRRVTNNIQRSSTLFLMKTFFTAALTFLAIIMSFCRIEGFAYPFNSANIILFEWFVIGIPSFFLSIQPDNKRINGNFIQNIIAKAVPAAATLLISVLAIMVLQYLPAFQITPEKAILMEMITFTFAGGFIVLYKTCRRFNSYRVILFSACLICAITALCLLPLGIFDIHGIQLDNLNLLNWMTIAIIILFCSLSYKLLRTLSNWLVSLKTE